jgi:predicted hotdog family 3-hydroxylacyl-ACP dehydratase
MTDNLLEEPILSAARIIQLIPQKPPFVMVDSLYEYTQLTGKMGFTIPADNILVENGHFSEPGIIEHMAQSMSLHRGYRGFLAGLEKPETGFIGSIKSVEVFTLPQTGSKLTTYVNIQHEIKNVTMVSARTEDENGNLIATSDMRTVTVV